MNILDQDIHDIFTKELPKRDSNFTIRDEQIEFAERIQQIFEKGGTLVAEAGTGIGKSYAYIIPALKQAVKNKQVVIVTGTIALQHQLADKDIPKMQELLQTDIPVVVLKGKTNYLCGERLQEFSVQESGKIIPRNNFEKKSLEKIQKWAVSTVSGDKEEINSIVPVPPEIWSQMSTHDYKCGGKRCQKKNYSACHYMHVRKQAKQVGIVITNYSLFSYHLQNINEEGDGLFSDNTIYILDEAHNLMEHVRKGLAKGIELIQNRQFYDSMFGPQGNITLDKNARGGAFPQHIQKSIEQIQNKNVDINKQLEKISKSVLDVKSSHRELAYLSEINYDKILEYYPEIIEKFRLLEVDFQSYVDILSVIISQHMEEDELRDFLFQCKLWGEQRLSIATLFSKKEKRQDIVLWCATKHKKEVDFYIAPLFVHGFLKNFFEKAESIVCTSATLTYQNEFSYWLQRNGVPDTADTIQLESPFPYKEKVLFVVPTDAPEVTHNDAYVDYLLEMLPECLDISNGRALILCTSNAMVKSISTGLFPISLNRKWHVLAQDGSRTVGSLADQFREDPHSVLVATASFWEGYDAPGDTLQLLVITRIPFPSPDELFIDAEGKSIIEQTADRFASFKSISLPIAETRLRQGFGRLMRSKEDGGVVLLTDNRLFGKYYGPQLKDALPNCAFSKTDTRMALKEIASHLS